MKKKQQIHLVGMAAAVILSGCQGPETRVLPRQNVSQEQPYELTGMDTVLEEANPFYLQEALDFLSAAPRPCGSAEETNAAEYIKRLMIEYGYDVTLQHFPVKYESAAGYEYAQQYGTNVIAVKEPEQKDSGILLISTSHDTVDASPGANVNASGVVAFLETARLVARISTEMELRFVSFSGTNYCQQGIRNYMEGLTKEEQERMIGVVHLDTLGYLYDDTVMLGTVDGNPTLVSGLLAEMAVSELEQTWAYRMDDNGGYPVFERYRIPAVRVSQGITAFEQGLPQDRPGIVDVEKLGEVSRVLSQTLVKMMREESDVYLKQAREGRYYRDGALIHRTDRKLPFGKTQEAVELIYGSSGTYLETEQEEEQWFQYRMKWLNVDQIILTDFMYQDGVLTKMELEAEAAGIEYEEMKQRLEQLYGAGQAESEAVGEEVLIWEDYAGMMTFKMTKLPERYMVEVAAGQTREVGFARYPVAGGLGTDEEQKPVRHNAALELTEQMLRPEERKQINEIILFTDGIGGRQAYLSEVFAEETEEADAADETSNSDRIFNLYVDLEDMTDIDGNYRDITISCRQVVCALAIFYEDEYSGLFYEEFDKTIEDGFASAFGTFVLTGRPESDVLEADARILFFYQYEPLAAVRKDIRRQLGLPL